MRTKQRSSAPLGSATGITDSRPTAVDRVWAVARIATGWIFLWAFADKMFGLGYATPAEGAWLNGGSPTKGFLSGSAAGPLKDFYVSIAGSGWADWLFMMGLLGIGAALILGIGMRIAAVSAAVMLTLMWSVALPPGNNPVIDDHIIMAILVIGLACANAGDTWGLGRIWSRSTFVKDLPVLR